MLIKINKLRLATLLLIISLISGENICGSENFQNGYFMDDGNELCCGNTLISCKSLGVSSMHKCVLYDCCGNQAYNTMKQFCCGWCLYKTITIFFC